MLVQWWQKWVVGLQEWLLEKFLLHLNSKVSAVVITLVEGEKRRSIVLFEQRLNWVGIHWVLCYQTPYSSKYFTTEQIPVARVTYTRKELNAYFRALKVRYNPDQDDTKIFRPKTAEIAPAFQRLQ